MNSDYIFFFFKQKTAYEISVRDWSSDVCSSDLEGPAPARDVQGGGEPHRLRNRDPDRGDKGAYAEDRRLQAPSDPGRQAQDHSRIQIRRGQDHQSRGSEYSSSNHVGPSRTISI